MKHLEYYLLQVVHFNSLLCKEFDVDFPFQNNKNDLIWTRRCGDGEAGWLKQKILNPTCQAITSPNMNLTQQTSVSNEKITGNKEYSILRIVSTHYMQNSAFKLMHEYVFQTADEYFFLQQ